MACELRAETKKKLENLVQRHGKEEAIRIIRDELTDNRRVSVLQAQKTTEIKSDLDNFADKYSKNKDRNSDEWKQAFNDGFTWKLAHDPNGRAGYANIDRSTDAWQDVIMSPFAPYVRRLEVKITGKPRDPKFRKDFLSELDGKASGDADAKAAADIYTKQMEFIRTKRNSLGSTIGKIDKYYLPQSHNLGKISKVSKESWKQSIIKDLDVDATVSSAKGNNIDEVLDAHYDTIMGLETSSGTIRGRRTNLAEKRDHHERKIFFKDATAQQRYHAKFGDKGDDIAGAIKDHFRTASREISLQEVLGPDWERTIGDLIDDGTLDLRHTNAKRILVLITPTNESILTVATGRADEVASADIKFATGAANVRLWMIMTKLGSATLTAMADTASVVASSGFYNLPRFGAFKHAFKKGSIADHAHAGFIHSEINDPSVVLSKVADAGAGGGTPWVQRLTKAVIDGSLLTGWTNQLKKGIVWNIARTYGKDAGKPFSKLSAGRKELLEAHGITSGEWEILRRQALQTWEGNKYIMAGAIEDLDLQLKWRRLLNTEQDIGVPTPDARARAAVGGGIKKGTVPGELARISTQFWSTPMAIMYNNVSRVLGGRRGLKHGLAYMAEFHLLSVISGYTALNLNNLASGKDWIDINELDAGQLAQLYVASAIKGGSFGWFGDSLFRTIADDGYGTQLTDVTTSPVLSDLTRLLAIPAKLLGGEADLGDRTEVAGAALIDFGLKEVPGQNIWYLKLIWNRFIADQIRKLVDPNFDKKVRRSETRLEGETETDYFWTPGDLEPNF